jgi:arabinogalactan oligomer/maltooligosaccharide transport system substrate-binding protein
MRVWSEDRDWAQQMMAQFEALHPEYAFYWLYEEEGTYGLPQRLAAYQDLDPAVDVMVYLRSDLDELLALDALAPVTGSVSSGVPQVLTDAVTHSDGKRYGLPLSAQGDVLFYNKDLYTPEDLGSLETLMAKGRVSYSLSASNTSLALFLANGCTVYGPKGNDFSAGVQLGGGRGHEVVLRLTELLNDPALGDRYLSRNRMDVEDMATGTVGAWIGSYSMYRQFLSVMGPDKLGVAALPTLRIGARDVPIQTTVDPLCVGVGRDSEHPALAQELAAFLASRESQLLRYSLCGSLPADTALKNDPAVAQYPHRVTSMEMVERGCYYPLSFQGTPEYLTCLNDLLIEIVNGKVTKDDCRERWDQYLKNIQ